jgi:hypothetical protein
MDDTDTANDQTHNYTEMSSASLWLQTTLSFQQSISRLFIFLKNHNFLLSFFLQDKYLHEVMFNVTNYYV